MSGLNSIFFYIYMDLSGVFGLPLIVVDNSKTKNRIEIRG